MYLTGYFSNQLNDMWNVIPRIPGLTLGQIGKFSELVTKLQEALLSLLGLPYLSNYVKEFQRFSISV